MANKNEISIPIQGMVTDSHNLNVDEKSYCFALNTITSDFFAGNEFMLGNEPSNICAVSFPPNYQVIGFIEVPEQKRTIYILVNLVTGAGQIGEALNCDFDIPGDIVEKAYCANCPEYVGTERTPLQKQEEICHCEYYIIAPLPCLKLDVNYPVDMEYKLTECGINIYYTDNLNERGYMYLDYEDGKITDHLKLSNRMKKFHASVDNNCGCPVGYIYNEAENICKQKITTPIVPSGTQRVACAASSIAYTNFGVALYSPGYNINGTGTSSIIHLADSYWSNPTVSPTAGILNRTALWACGPGGTPQGGEMQPTNEYIGYIFPLEVPATKTYYIGIAGDNEVRIRVDCNDIVVMDDSAMAVQYPVAGMSAPFKYWHIYPVTLTAGHHVVELTGINFGQVAGFGAEIYDNTAQEIINATTGNGLNIIFTTQGLAGTPLQVSSTFSGNCPGGGCLDIIGGQLVCVTYNTAPADCTDCVEIIYEDDIDCEKLKVYPDYEKPCVEFLEFINGGQLKEGVYQVLVAYSDVYGNPITNYFPSSSTAPLFNEQIKFETNGETNKALKFRINNIVSNSFFEYYNLVIAQTIDNFTEFIEVGTFSTNQSNYIYTGYEKSVQRKDPANIFFRYPYYPLAKGVTKANKYLFYSGVTEYPTLNLQRVANNINLYWETVAIKEAQYHDPRNTFYFHTYQRDEVYAFGIVFEFSNGRESCAFHIPGRQPTATDLEVITNADVINNLDCFDEPLNKRWQLYNTADVIAGDYEYNETCQVDKCWEYGNFSYWESTELYPKNQEIWGELCGKPILHHKMPDSCVSHIHDSENGSKVFKDSNYIFPIGVRVDHQSVLNALEQGVTDGLITEDEKDTITSYRIVRGNRVGNKSVTAKGLIFNMFKYSKYIKDYYFPNYAYNDLSSDDFLNGVSLTDSRYTFHSPDTHFVNTGIGNILKVETEEYGQSEGYFTHSDCQARHKFLSKFIHTLAFGLGLAAAFSATGEKECRVITYQSDVVIAGEDGYGDVSQGGYVLTSGTAIPRVPNVSTTGKTVKTTDTEVYNKDQRKLNDPDTGLVITDPLKSSKEEITTCKGQPWQVFNSNTVIGTVLASVGAFAKKGIQRTMLGLIEMDKIIETMHSLIPYKNYSIQYNSAGKYNNYSCVAEGKKVRLISKSAYLTPNMQTVDEPSTGPDTLFKSININNWDRESSVYLKTASVLANPTHADDSKVSMSALSFNVNDLDRTFNRNIASYYVSLKDYVPNQYGQICNINYLETSACSFYLNEDYTECESAVFGGDTFINRFSLKRKMPFFLHTMCGLPDGSDVLYNELGNAGTPKYYFNTPEPFGARLSDIRNPLGILNLIASENDSNYDVNSNKLFYQNGYIHLFNYGIPSFLVESDINVDYRHGQNNKEKDFYPHNKNLKQWLEEKNVPIHEDNYYFYNKTYSKQNHESPICTSCIKDLKEIDCKGLQGNRLIYSEPLDTENKNDNWLIYKANNYYDFSLTDGNLISADGIENDKVLVRLEKGTKIFSAYNTIQATGENIQVGTGGIFQSRPKDIAITDLGYAGTSNKDILHTEYGHVWADAERGNVFNLHTGGDGIDELAKDGMRNWFKENLPFSLRKSFPEITAFDTDNNLNGIGLHYAFDKRFNRFLITKLDYKVLDKTVKYNPETKTFFRRVGQQDVKVELYNPKYFCNKSWTISYNFYTKSWTSFHSYKPNFYVEHLDNFESGYKKVGSVNQKTYLHNASNKSYQVFYGKLEPFIVEFKSKFNTQNTYVHSIEYYLDIIRYSNEYDMFAVQNKTFNKAILYNELGGTSGLLHMKVSNPEDLTEIEYPKRVADGYEILTTNSNGVWNFNDFWDVTANVKNNLPIFNYDCNNVNKTLNSKAINYDIPDFDRPGIKNKQLKVRLINDKESLYKFIFGFSLIKKQETFR